LIAAGALGDDARVGRVDVPRLLVAHVAADGAREYLVGVAHARGGVYLALEVPPTDSGEYLLVVQTPGGGEPLVLCAEPLGPPTAKGTPLRLRLRDPTDAPIPKKSLAIDPSKKKKTQAVTLQEISGDAPEGATTTSFVGRELAGGKLVIERCVGVGGAGTVYRARHRDLQMHVAVKLMHESFQRDAAFCRRFHAEALSASRLDHANLTRVYDFGQEPDGLLYIAMEFLDGRTLRQILDAEKRLAFERVASMMINVCSGLTHAHARGIVHRDIKPENLVMVRGLDDDGRETELVKVCDFGIAHTANTDADFGGTAEYVSPEQFEGATPDAQTDVYACGVVLYELLTGVVPIPGEFPGIVKKVIETTPVSPSRHVADLDARVDRLVMKAIAKDREIRHASVRELRAELKQVAEEIAVFSSGGYWSEPGPATGARRNTAPVVVQEAKTEDWLEHGPNYLAAISPSLAPVPASAPPPSVRASRPSSSHVEPPSRPPGSVRGDIQLGSSVGALSAPTVPLATDLARAVAPFLQRLAATTDPAKFAALVAPVEAGVRTLLAQGQTAAAWRVCSTLDLVARDPPGPLSRAASATKALEVFGDPAVLAPLAEKALDGVEDKERVASKLVIRAGRRGAHALYQARLKHGVFEARERFIALMQAIGGAGVPVVVTALERLETRLAVPGAVYVAEDLLKALPEEYDEALAQLVARYAKHEIGALALPATNALPRVCGDRARTLLRAQLHHKDDDVVMAAMARLRSSGGVDREILSQLEPWISGALATRPRLRLAAVEALVDATPETRPSAHALLATALANTVGTTPDVEDLVVVIAHTLITSGGDAALVAERWRKSHTWLRTRLEAVLRGAPPHAG
jgi:serine/threonine-protein kinase